MPEKPRQESIDQFAFGENWASYAAGVSSSQIGEARDALAAFLGAPSLAGMDFLDIGSGSGIHSLAALLLGARRVLALDIDGESVATTHQMLRHYAPPDTEFEVKKMSILSAEPPTLDSFDVVYSWGVLHHTGRMREAIARAAQLAKPGGLFAFALYRRTMLCGAWKAEKRFYAKAPKWAQSMIRAAFIAVFRLRLALTGRSFTAYVSEYAKQRGMDFNHDVHDWLGGWPYESISPEEVEGLMSSLGFVHMRSVVHRQRLGLFGAGCNEYVYRRALQSEPTIRVDSPSAAAKKA